MPKNRNGASWLRTGTAFASLASVAIAAACVPLASLVKPEQCTTL